MNQTTDMFTTIKIKGEDVRVNIERIPALDGYEIRDQAIKVMMNGLKGTGAAEDSQLRRAFAVRVLSYVSVQHDEETIIPLSSERAINDQLPGANELEHVLNEVLRQNEIPVHVPLVVEQYWGEAGRQVAAEVMAAISALLINGMAGKSVAGLQAALDEAQDKANA
ncbi:hypothetical protein [Cupriavidus nantongensis]|uniref:Uncharacterized protein n=1 Tax=Cupriavidus nantongensis TaxID=1796606 RepID=A0A142JNG5_9BURK|nr:hypothetical protein [Cupriavidus nantongensis]AMR79627.1 hypothetical protein A2G96_18785 [Cupriavidus nantongensis]